MASGSSLFSEEHFQCAICLEVFQQPVSTPCGHNFCMSCLTAYWDNSVVCQCPLCKTTFDRKPVLGVNTFISDLVEQFKAVELTVGVTQSQNPQPVNAVLCDICIVNRKEAIKSCINCLTSYCTTHLEPHQRVAGLKRHALINPLENLEERVCKEHNMLLKAFCKNDMGLLCDVCIAVGHANHESIPLPQAHQETKVMLVKLEAKVQQMIQERLQQFSTVKESVKLCKDVVANSVQDLDTLMSDIQKCQAELFSVVKEKENLARKQADDFVNNMEQKIAIFQSGTIKILELMQTKDSLKFLQRLPNLSGLFHPMGLSAFSFNSDLEVQCLKTSLSQLISQMLVILTKINEEKNKFSKGADVPNTFLKAVQKFEVTFELDPNTAHHQLILSKDGKQVRYSTQIQRLSKSESRFTNLLGVLGNRGFSSCKFYFEVHVGQKTEFVVGVATASIRRYGSVTRTHNSGLWAIWFMRDRFESHSSPFVSVHWGKVQRVGVFVDYTGRHIAFYDVHTTTLIHSFTQCVFTEALYPYFNPCDNEHGSNWDPMVIVPVNHPA
ncbi:E3 ubiquitin-protein ligase TRIM38-like [Thalassophryne amazonica]|uniref:E3 ubiquitin-protein ligase TRIM38-like n=1 Tax=Thalassophryne amazonica TaxID=390379 RepID=UPI001470A041|nr:E3 ubiquitin-protein ligase TRIM38-like [Thalassophryne amazonica]